MHLIKSTKSLLCAVFIGVLSALATTAPVVADGVIEDIQKRGALRVGMATFVPWAMRDKKGNLIGFEIDVATKVANTDVKWNN